MDLLEDLRASIADRGSVLWTLSLLGQVDPDAELEYRQVPVAILPPPLPSNVRTACGAFLVHLHSLGLLHVVALSMCLNQLVVACVCNRLSRAIAKRPTLALRALPTRGDPPASSSLSWPCCAAVLLVCF